jgi:hypothetical protein
MKVFTTIEEIDETTVFRLFLWKNNRRKFSQITKKHLQINNEFSLKYFLVFIDMLQPQPI